MYAREEGQGGLFSFFETSQWQKFNSSATGGIFWSKNSLWEKSTFTHFEASLTLHSSTSQRRFCLLAAEKVSCKTETCTKHIWWAETDIRSFLLSEDSQQIGLKLMVFDTPGLARLGPCSFNMLTFPKVVLSGCSVKPKQERVTYRRPWVSTVTEPRAMCVL